LNDAGEHAIRLSASVRSTGARGDRTSAFAYRGIWALMVGTCRVARAPGVHCPQSTQKRRQTFCAGASENTCTAGDSTLNFTGPIGSNAAPAPSSAAMRGAAWAPTPEAGQPGQTGPISGRFPPTRPAQLRPSWHSCAGAAAMKLPDYDPPSDRRAGVAAGLAPLFVLLAFTLLVSRVIDPDTGFAVFLACTVWVAYEMHDHQRRIDAFNAEYVASHLAWRSSAALEALVAGAEVHAPTREFVQRFLSAGRVLLRDGQSV
jgi:hypothetical protein